MAQMFQILSQTNAVVTAMTDQYVARQEQEQAKAEAQHQASWTILPFMPQVEEKWHSLEEQL
ncbi:hypothetical protein CR513_49658, partial [Mucuna pruriens]